MARICLDFDGVIHDPTNRDPGYKMGKPVEGALEAVTLLLAHGHEVIVHSARVQDPRSAGHVYD